MRQLLSARVLPTIETVRNGFIFLIVISCCLLLATQLYATQTTSQTANQKLNIKVRSGAIKVDGVLDDAGWKDAQRVSAFVERHPGDNTKPLVETEAYLTFDDEYLYVAFKCQDDPASIRATMCQRDQFGADDAVGFMLDTYGDATWAYEFFVNPHGIQKDRLWSQVGGEDIGFDLIWNSAAKISDEGYVVEMAIPFTSMRFPNKDVQSWKVDFWRIHPRESYRQYSWTRNDRDEQCWPCQWGELNGIMNAQPGKGFELLPTVIADQTSTLSSPNDLRSSIDDLNPDAEIALNGKYAISSDITLEGAFNPDFSQIEADADQIDVNSTIALLFPERRPLFQEGADIFRTLFNSFYTRTVNDPQFALKLTGRKRGLSFGVLSALDENSLYTIPLQESGIVRNTGKSLVNVARLTKSFGDNSRIGGMLTDRRWEGSGSASIASLDANLRLSSVYSFIGQWVLSHAAESDELGATEGLEGITFDKGKHTAIFDGESYYGDATIMQFRRFSQNINFILNYDHVSPSYRTQTGYDPWNDYRNGNVNTWYTFRPENGIIERITPQLNTQNRWNYDGEQKWGKVGGNLSVNFRMAQSSVSLFYNRGFERWFGNKYDDLWTWSVNINSRPNGMFSFYGYYNRSLDVALFAEQRGNGRSYGFGYTFKPVDRLIISPNMDFARLSHETTNESFYRGYIMRTRFDVQANRELSVRLVVQYNNFSDTWEFDPLVTYRLSSFSVFYAGVTYDFDKYREETKNISEWNLSNRRFFMKLQYLFQV